MENYKKQIIYRNSIHLAKYPQKIYDEYDWTELDNPCYISPFFDSPAGSLLHILDKIDIIILCTVNDEFYSKYNITKITSDKIKQRLSNFIHYIITSNICESRSRLELDELPIAIKITQRDLYIKDYD